MDGTDTPQLVGRLRLDLSDDKISQGLIKNGTTTANTAVFLLPTGYRPDATLEMIGYGSAGAAKFHIRADGYLTTGTNFGATNQSITCSFPT